MEKDVFVCDGCGAEATRAEIERAAAVGTVPSSCRCKDDGKTRWGIWRQKSLLTKEPWGIDP